MIKSLFNVAPVSVLIGLMLLASIMLVIALLVMTGNAPSTDPDNLNPDSGIFMVSIYGGWVFWFLNASFMLLAIGIAFILYRHHHIVSAILVIVVAAGLAIYWTTSIPFPSINDRGSSVVTRDISNGIPLLLTGGFIAVLLISLFSPDSRTFRWLYRSLLLILLLGLPILWALRPTPEVTLEFTDASYFVTESNTEIEITLQVSGSRDIPIEASLETLPFAGAGVAPASEGEDYKKATPTTFLIQPDDKLIPIRIPILDDNLPEITEGLIVVLKDRMSFIKLTTKKSTVIRISDNDTELENGTLLGGQNDTSTMQGFAQPKGTTQQATMIPHVQVGEISGFTGAGYLRTGTGDIYKDGIWYPIAEEIDDLRLPYMMNDYLPDLIRRADSDDARILNPPKAPGEGIQTSVMAEFDWQIHTLPLPQYLEYLDATGEYFLDNSTFYAREPTLSYAFKGKTIDIIHIDLEKGQAADSNVYLQIPEDIPESIFALARNITAGHTTDYAKAKALERYLKNNYTYGFATDRQSAIRPGQGYDPVVEFLIEHREGTCGNFSSAMVILARAVGLPARVVVGWAVSPLAENQQIFADQAHQWVEVAFKEIGWVEFEPTASGGAVDRVSARNGTHEVTLEFTEASYSITESNTEIEITLQVSGSRDIPIQAAIKTLPSLEIPSHRRARAGEDYEDVTSFIFDVQPDDEFIHLKIRIFDDAIDEDTEAFNVALRSGWPSVSLAERSSARIDVLDNDTKLENGTLLGSQNNMPTIQGFGQPKGTTQQAAMIPHVQIGEISGITGAGYLRTGTGDIYKDGIWYPIAEEPNASRIPYMMNDYLPDIIRRADSDDARVLNPPKAPGDGIPTSVMAEFDWQIHTLPLPQYVEYLDATGEYFPDNSTFYAREPTLSYAFKGKTTDIIQADLERAQAADSNVYLQLPEDMPESIFALARDITAGHTTDYAKAKAIERYLKDNYTYGFANDRQSAIRPGQGYDPVVEFLMERHEGTCGNFSSAMAILARAVGLPARVVVGWAVSPLAENQRIFADQAHQWVEVAFKEIGWVEFEPTASGGAVSRAFARNPGAGRGNGEPVVILNCTIKEGTTICIRDGNTR